MAKQESTVPPPRSARSDEVTTSEGATYVVLDRFESRLRDAFHLGSGTPSIAVVDGHGIRLSVDRGHLTSIDGVADINRTRVWSKATHGLSRVAVIASTGEVSIPALRWLRGAGVGLVVIDPFDGEVLATSAHTSNNDPRLRRAQACALGTATGVGIARYLIGLKLDGQARVARGVLKSPDASTTILKLRDDLNECRSIDEIRQTEAAAANLYFTCWRSVEVPFVKRDASRVPELWRGFQGRRSAVNPGSARSATDPLNAILNYCYRLLEAEGRILCLSIGLDPGLGVLHADMKGRDSLVLDLMEPVRPLVDEFVLQMFSKRPLLKAELAEDERGVVRLKAPLTHELALQLPRWSQALGPIVERVAHLFSSESPYEVSVPTVLTRQRHRDAAKRRVESDGLRGSDSLRARGPNLGGMVSERKARQKPASLAPKPPGARCKQCGGEVPASLERVTARASYCPNCLSTRRQEIGRMIQSLPKRTSVVSEESSAKRSQENASERALRKQFDDEHSGEEWNPSEFRSTILPTLQQLSLTTIARAIGVSTSTASKIRSGQRVPHPRHWEGLERLGRTGRHGNQSEGAIGNYV